MSIGGQYIFCPGGNSSTNTSEYFSHKFFIFVEKCGGGQSGTSTLTGFGAPQSFLGPTLTDLTWSSWGQLCGKIPRNFWVDHDSSRESDNLLVTMAVIVRHCPPGRCRHNLHVPTIFMSAFWASDSLYLSELGSIVAPIFLQHLVLSRQP